MEPYERRGLSRQIETMAQQLHAALGHLGPRSEWSEMLSDVRRLTRYSTGTGIDDRVAMHCALAQALSTAPGDAGDAEWLTLIEQVRRLATPEPRWWQAEPVFDRALGWWRSRAARRARLHTDAVTRALLRGQLGVGRVGLPMPADEPTEIPESARGPQALPATRIAEARLSGLVPASDVPRTPAPFTAGPPRPEGWQNALTGFLVNPVPTLTTHSTRSMNDLRAQVETVAHSILSGSGRGTRFPNTREGRIALREALCAAVEAIPGVERGSVLIEVPLDGALDVHCRLSTDARAEWVPGAGCTGCNDDDPCEWCEREYGEAELRMGR